MSILTGFDLCRAAMAVKGVSAPEQSVLTVLALMANGEAQCFPPINGDNGLVAKTKLSERAVQRAIQQLCALGHIDRKQVRHGVIYTIHPVVGELTPATQSGVSVTPDTGTPVSEAPRGACVAPKQPETTIPSPEASPPTKARAARRDRKTGYHRLPDDWAPKALPEPLRARVDQWPPGPEADELDAFRGWAANAKDEDGKGRKLDWDQAWHNWLRKADERHRPRANRPYPQQGAGRTVSAASRTIARMVGGRTA